MKLMKDIVKLRNGGWGWALCVMGKRIWISRFFYLFLQLKTSHFFFFGVWGCKLLRVIPRFTTGRLITFQPLIWWFLFLWWILCVRLLYIFSGAKRILETAREGLWFLKTVVSLVDFTGLLLSGISSKQGPPSVGGWLGAWISRISDIFGILDTHRWDISWALGIYRVT